MLPAMMIASSHFLLDSGLATPTGKKSDPMVDAVGKFECARGLYPIAFDRRATQ